MIYWGYYATVEVCRTWFALYRLVSGGMDGNASVYTLSRQDLQRWYYVEKLTCTQLQRRYLTEHGVYSYRKHLTTWLTAEAQKPEKLEINERIHSHAAGEFVLLQLQHGKSPQYVVSELMSKYLVEASIERVAAYRFYRQQLGAYWTMRRLERLQWEFIYGLVTIDSKFGGKNRHIRPTRARILHTARTVLCKSMQVSEELVPLKVLDEFFAKHEEYARLTHKYPQALICKDTLPLSLIDAYRSTFATDEVLPDCGFKLVHPKEYRGSWRACQVAESCGYIAVPRACGDAALIAAYAMHKCRELYQHHCMHGSRLSATQQVYCNTYPKVDFSFWVMYGSWSTCPHCWSLHFNDQYFKESVYQLRTTSSTPDLLAASRRQLRYDPIEHSYGDVADSSRWWYLPGMYQPSMHCRRCSKPPTLKNGAAPGSMMLSQLKQRKAKYDAAAQKSKDGVHGRDALTSGSLYRVPYVGRIPLIAEEWRMQR